MTNSNGIGIYVKTSLFLAHVALVYWPALYVVSLECLSD